jgi:hypothetical protein
MKPHQFNLLLHNSHTARQSRRKCATLLKERKIKKDRRFPGGPSQGRECPRRYPHIEQNKYICAAHKLQ